MLNPQCAHLITAVYQLIQNDHHIGFLANGASRIIKHMGGMRCAGKQTGDRVSIPCMHLNAAAFNIVVVDASQIA